MHIIAVRIAFWVFAHCILVYLLIKIENFATLLAPCGSNNRYMSNVKFPPTLINKKTGPPSEPIFLGDPPFSVKNNS
jgi:hypothetical protein